MANYASIKATIDANIKANNNQEITGTILNSVLDEMVDALAAGYLFKGVASTSTNPGSPDEKVFYVASPGTYLHFGNQVVPEAATGFFKWDSSWHLETISTGVADGGVTTQKIADGAVTAAKLAGTLATDLLATGYKYMGVASPSTVPGTPTQNVFYFAGAGVYPNFSNLSIGTGQLGVLRYDGSWHKDTLPGNTMLTEMAMVAEDGLYFVDSDLNVGAKMTQEGFVAINSITINDL